MASSPCWKLDDAEMMWMSWTERRRMGMMRLMTAGTPRMKRRARMLRRRCSSHCCCSPCRRSISSLRTSSCRCLVSSQLVAVVVGGCCCWGVGWDALLLSCCLMVLWVGLDWRATLGWSVSCLACFLLVVAYFGFVFSTYHLIWMVAKLVRSADVVGPGRWLTAWMECGGWGEWLVGSGYSLLCYYCRCCYRLDSWKLLGIYSETQWP